MDEFRERDDERREYEQRESEENFFDEKEDYGEFGDAEEVYQQELQQRQDDFLDVYGTYLKKKDKFQKSMLQRKVIELELLDPNFQFHID